MTFHFKFVRFLGIAILGCLQVTCLQAQNAEKTSQKQVDSATFNVYISAAYAYNFPFADWAKMFKSHSSINANIGLKTASNWTFDINYCYLFNNTIDSAYATYVLGKIINSSKLIIDENGVSASISVEQRGWSMTFNAGKIFPVLPYNKNSGIWLKISGGYMEYKYKLGNLENNVPQLLGDYAKLYDNKSRAFVCSQFLGFFYMSKFRMLNFYGGVEVSEIWGKSIRGFFMPLNGPDLSTKFGMQVGLKFGWFIPLHEKRKIKKVYYF